ncbi:UDP-N-acetylmuramoyl-L-alanyl-D-glutamate--2,6-diaminopimelate ligase [Aliicoccus persicus]|uniref:UDP-N-acetylmuramoyl-L-alanyl-D-glutamate--L-lysine ligase n=1 Tax=Aliicoccus persicus TaxID=930138 RepID=A0A662Z3G7_9STAP|nr:UDP-N-acetylmuramoyl-L-alanyl-D-glutamate--2,6-diaminopimelate ligase [Aliicoccus persicus]SEW03029.1 UDP-N-acetylmuramoylalanyl-D-glutamate--2,6-diaminopimelate ligase [Aliicoccus persicus]
MKVSELLNLIKIKETYGTFPENVHNITQDSREVDEHSVFVAVKGLRVDGHDFIDSAIEAGCRMIVASKFVETPEHVGLIVVRNSEKAAAKFSEYIYDFPHKNYYMIGVTGTNGKTTVSTMIHHLSRALGKNSAYLGTNGFLINETRQESLNTTPETTRLHKRLVDAREANSDVFTMEVSSHALQIGRSLGIEYDITIFTNLTQDHLDFHKTMDAYGFSKGLLFSQMGQDVKKEKYAILNDDDPWSNIYENMTAHEVVTYGMSDRADFYPTNINGSLAGFSFTLNTPEGAFEVESPYIGEFNIQNLMCAIISEWLQGFSLENIVQAIPKMSPVEGRLEVLDPRLPVDIIIDFAHTPDALSKIFDTVEPFVRGKLIFLVGMTGERDYSKGREMGEITSRADVAIYTPDNPANDDPQMLVDLLVEGATHDNYYGFVDRAEGIRKAVELSNPGDTIVLACKGREPYQIVENYIKAPHRDDLIALESAYEKYGKTEI